MTTIRSYITYDGYSSDMPRKNVAADFVADPERTLNINGRAWRELAQVRQFDSFLNEIETNQRPIDFGRRYARAIHRDRRTKLETCNKATKINGDTRYSGAGLAGDNIAHALNNTGKHTEPVL